MRPLRRAWGRLVSYLALGIWVVGWTVLPLLDGAVRWVRGWFRGEE